MRDSENKSNNLGICGVRSIFGIIVVLLYFFLMFTAIKLLGYFEFDVMALSIWMTILVEGGDRVIRYFIEFKKRIKHVRYLKRIDKSNKTLKSFTSVPERYSDTLNEFEIEPYVIMFSTYNIENVWKKVKKSMEPWKNEIYILDDNSKDMTRDLISDAGFNLIKNPSRLHKPGSILHGLSRIPPEIETVMVIDPDVELPDRITLERVIFDFQRSGAAACGIQVLPS